MTSSATSRMPNNVSELGDVLHGTMACSSSKVITLVSYSLCQVDHIFRNHYIQCRLHFSPFLTMCVVTTNAIVNPVALTLQLLIKILVAVGDVWDLPAIALTCRRLAGLVYGVSPN